jgi:hypothetical protein
VTEAGVPRDVLAAWAGLSVEPSPYGTGLLNLTLRGELRGAPVVVQRVHPVFAPSVHHDIEAVTRHLAAKGLTTPRLVPTSQGELCHVDQERRPWRVLTLIQNTISHDVVVSPALAREAGRTVGRFHAAVSDLEHSYRHVRPHVHDAAHHLPEVHRALAAEPSHRLAREVERVARALDALAPSLVGVDAVTRRHAHGDLKISNLLFDEGGNGVCLVDLDTLSRMSLPLELGDALRSWCNPAKEDAALSSVDEALFEAALVGWSEGIGGLRPSRAEVESIVPGLLTIATVLAARFAADALRERYFGWDRTRFSAAGEHNLVRAEGQLALARSVVAARSSLEAIVRRVFGSG